MVRLKSEVLLFVSFCVSSVLCFHFPVLLILVDWVFFMILLYLFFAFLTSFNSFNHQFLHSMFLAHTVFHLFISFLILENDLNSSKLKRTGASCITLLCSLVSILWSSLYESWNKAECHFVWHKLVMCVLADTTLLLLC